jgi:formiminotetrahydrofolate cyclodeaminase
LSEEKELIQRSCASFADILASKSAVPGGGGAAALVGALGSALGMMYLNLSIGKKKYAQHEADFQKKVEDLGAIKDELLSCVEEDAAAFRPLAKAYSMPKDTEVERERYRETLETALYTACGVPEKIMDLCEEALDAIEAVAGKGSELAKSDAAAAAMLCMAALNAAHLNVLINTTSMSNRVEAEAITDRCDSKLMRNNIKASELIDELRDEIRQSK